MKAFAVVLAMTLGVGCIVAAAWLGSQPPPEKAEVQKPAEAPIPAGVVVPEISPTGPYPKAVVSENMHDFGVGVLHGKGQHTFIIRNEGEAPLVLLAHEKDRTCQCTGAKLAGDGPVMPGEETEVQLSWEIKQNNPSFTHSAKIRTNDPENKVITLTAMGRVERQYLFDPPYSIWDMGSLETDGIAKSSKMIFSEALESFQIKSVKSANPRFKFTWEPLEKEALDLRNARSGYRIHVEVDTTDLSGTVNESADLETESNGETAVTSLSLHYRKSVAMELMARNFDPMTNRLSIGEFPASEGKTVEISVITRVGDVNLVSVQSAHDAVKATWEKDEKFQSKSATTRRYLLKLEIPPASPVSRRRDDSEKVELKFDHPRIGTMAVFVDYLSV